MNSRRKFLACCGSIIAATGLTYSGSGNTIISGRNKPKQPKGMQTLRFKPYELQMKHVFTIAEGSRSTTPVMLTEISSGNTTGYGEASMPPYLGENHSTATAFLSKVDLSLFESPFLMEDILQYVDQLAPGNYAAKASVDIALHDLVGKLIGQPWYRIWGLNPKHTPNTSFTIGIDNPDVVKSKTVEATAFKILKVKMSKDNGREMITAVRSVTNLPLCVDVNQGWSDRQEALDMICWLKEQGVVYVEQPMSKTAFDDTAWLTQRSPLPIIADEAFQTIGDLEKVKGVYSGINVKLMKCGGMRAAYIIMKMAKALGMRVMIGCMTETSCAVTAAAQLSPLADWADLDGNLLIKNDVFSGIRITDGRVMLPEEPGIGIRLL
jgi:L-alanine-DL-glutamate epimerase-like enolase superfamily enzyme